MKRHKDRLDQLFEAARSAPSRPIGPMPVRLKTRVLACWRSGDSVEDSLQALALIFRRALLCAGLVMMFSIAWSLQELMNDPKNVVAIANYELRADVMP